jgi:hypothetical protein
MRIPVANRFGITRIAALGGKFVFGDIHNGRVFAAISPK